jgi:hypothetical protein
MLKKEPRKEVHVEEEEKEIRFKGKRKKDNRLLEEAVKYSEKLQMLKKEPGKEVHVEEEEKEVRFREKRKKDDRLLEEAVKYSE